MDVIKEVVDIMVGLLSIALVFGLTFFMSTLLQPLALRIGLVDAPGGRKQHKGNIPLVGGIAMFVGVMLALLTLPISLSDYRAFLAGCVLLVVLGILDDFHELSARNRFVGQIIAAVLMVFWGNLQLHSLGNLLFWGHIHLYYLAIPFTVICVVGMINAVNMLDGLDGLAGGITLVELLILLCLARHAHLAAAVSILSLFVSAVIGFLYFNFHWPWRQQALIFMGDAGSMFLGFALSWFLVALSQGTLPAAKPVTLLWVMCMPLFDMATVVLRRILKKQSPLISDRQHIHYLLQARGYSSWQIVAMLCLAAIVGAGVGIGGEYGGVSEGVMFVGFLCFFAIYFRMVTFFAEDGMTE